MKKFKEVWACNHRGIFIDKSIDLYQAKVVGAEIDEYGIERYSVRITQFEDDVDEDTDRSTLREMGSLTILYCDLDEIIAMLMNLKTQGEGMLDDLREQQQSKPKRRKKKVKKKKTTSSKRVKK